MIVIAKNKGPQIFPLAKNSEPKNKETKTLIEANDDKKKVKLFIILKTLEHRVNPKKNSHIDQQLLGYYCSK